MAAEPVEFTRGSLGAADTRGLSLVERHAEARARALEEETLARLHAIFGSGSSSSSQVPLSVLALAASAAPGPDAREAEALVREFLADKGRELDKLFKTRDDGKKTKPSTSSSDDADDGSSSDEDRKGRHRRSKHKKESKKHSKRHGKKKEDKKSKKKKKKRRRGSDSGSGSDSDESGGGGGGEKRATKRAAAATSAKPAAATTAALTSQYGSHGLLRAENPHDAELKRSEFFSWCSEVKKVPSMEALARWEETELWKTFVEDFNTATLPSEKYYDLVAWQQQKAREEEARRRRRGKGGEGGEAPMSAADDEAARRAEAKKRREDEAAERLKEAYNALKYSDAGKKEDMKRQELLRIELQVAARTGDTEKVARLQKLLAPDPK